jgi:C1A family cysteine protease
MSNYYYLKFFVISILLSSCLGLLYSQDVIVDEPVPDVYSSRKVVYTKDGFPLSEMPPVPLDAVRNPKYIKGLVKLLSFPSSYDLRSLGMVTSAKNQGNCGSCWAFASIGAIESYLKKLGYPDYNLSENNMKECHGFEWGGCAGGNNHIAASYLIRGRVW